MPAGPHQGDRHSDGVCGNRTRRGSRSAHGGAHPATVQFLAALPDQPPALRPMSPMLEFEQTPNPLRDHLAQEPIAQKKGIVKVPTGPGLGIEIDREVLKKYKVA